MEYLSPVINRVHNKLNYHMTIRLSNTTLGIPSNGNLDVNFDIMSSANNTQRSDIFSAVKAGYVEVDILVLRDGKYEKVGEYSLFSTAEPVASEVKVVAPTSSADIAKSRGITVTEQKHKEESVNKVVKDETPKSDPLKARTNPDYRKSMKEASKPAKESNESALDNVKNNTKDEE